MRQIHIENLLNFSNEIFFDEVKFFILFTILFKDKRYEYSKREKYMQQIVHNCNKKKAQIIEINK